MFDVLGDLNADFGDMKVDLEVDLPEDFRPTDMLKEINKSFTKLEGKIDKVRDMAAQAAEPEKKKTLFEIRERAKAYHAWLTAWEFWCCICFDSTEQGTLS